MAWPQFSGSRGREDNADLRECGRGRPTRGVEWPDADDRSHLGRRRWRSPFPFGEGRARPRPHLEAFLFGDSGNRIWSQCIADEKKVLEAHEKATSELPALVGTMNVTCAKQDGSAYAAAQLTGSLTDKLKFHERLLVENK